MDEKKQIEYSIPASLQRMASLLQGKLFASIAVSGVLLGLHVPHWFCAVAGGLLYILFSVYEHRIFLPQLRQVPITKQPRSLAREAVMKNMLAGCFAFLLALFITCQKTYWKSNLLVLGLAVGVMVISAIYVLRLFTTCRKGGFYEIYRHKGL